MTNRRRLILTAVTGIFALIATSVYLPEGISLALTPIQKPKPAKRSDADRKALAKKPAPRGTLNDRLDKDDGYGIVLFISASVHGNLEVCGCPIHPLGGVARRAGYINAFRKRSPDAAIIQADAGYIFDDTRGESSKLIKDDARLMNDWIIRANDAMGLEIVNLSYRDLPYISLAMRPDAKIRPERSTWISANIKSVDGARPNPAPYLIKTVTGKRLSKPVRIAFIGISDVAPESYKEMVVASGFIIDDPMEAAKAALAEVRDKADVTVIVGYISIPTANKIARQNDDLDLIVASNERGLVPDPVQVNNALIVYAAKETKHLGELRFYTDAGGAVEKFTARYVELDEIIPDDGLLGAITKKARKEINELQNRLAEEEAKAFASRSGGAEGSAYVLSETCGKCHQAEYAVWAKSRHSHAFAALETKQRTFDAACIGCHSLGFQKGGFVNIKATPQFANVQCESCHGPGAAHVKVPTAGDYKTPAGNASCLICHDKDNSPDFDIRKYWPVVAHSRGENAKRTK